MKKIFYILASAIVALGAVACDNQDLDNIAPAGEGLTIVANIDDATKVAFDGLTPSWEAGDKLVIGNYTFEYTENNKFVCEAEGVYSLCDGKEKDITVGEFNSANGLKGSAWAAKSVIEKEDTKVTLKLTTAVLKYTTTAAGVTFHGTALSSEGIAATNNGEVQYIPVKTSEEKEYTFSYKVNGVECKSLTKKFVAGKVYNLGTLAFVATKSEYGVVGSFQTPTTWDVAAPVEMYTTKEEGWVVAEGVELYKSDEFKIVTGKSWNNPNFGGKDATLNAEVGTEYTLAQGGQNIKVDKNGKFNIYFNVTSKAFKVECVEEYSDLMVTITIDNKANWSPLYITLKDGNTVVEDKASVTNNKFAVSGNYIGKTLSYTLSNGSKETTGNVDITKTGATITLEETIVKLKVQLNTANAKQWWGNTMKIHVWETGTSFDTSWPGNTMTSEGNYTWSIIVPSELVGKTIKYLVHNGNGWQSKDATVTIKAEGNTVTGSSIGIN